MTSDMTCFANDLQRDLLDRQAFTFRHQLLGHPALTLENLGRMIPTLPGTQVHYSKGSLQRSDDFDQAQKLHGNGLSIEETIETIRTSDSYIMIRSPQTDASFQPLFRDLIGDIEGLMRQRGVGRQAHSPMLYLFISSPHSVTPFHIDRYANVLMQIQGTKEIRVFPQWDERIVPSTVRESVMAQSGKRVEWKPEHEALGTAFHLAPGDALHIPLAAGHHVLNGPEVSISLSIFFHTDATRSLSQAMALNDLVRRRTGLPLGAVGRSPLRDAVKAGVWRTGRNLLAALRGRTAST